MQWHAAAPTRRLSSQHSPKAASSHGITLVAVLPPLLTIAALAAALAAAHLSVAAAVGRGASPRRQQRLRMLLLSSLLSSSCFPIQFLPLLLSYPTGCGTITSTFFNAYSSCGSQRLRAACEQWHSIALAAAHRASCCDGPVGGSFASGFFLLEFIVEIRCDREHSNHTIACVRGCLCRSADNPHACACVTVLCCQSQEPQGR